jgi:serine beta-lactamase-like protein LACTB, mitochondrial
MMRTILPMVLVLVAGTAVSPASAVDLRPAPPETAAAAIPDQALIEAVTDRITREIEAQNIVGISVALVRDGRIISTRHFGWEDRERQIPASGATMYRWASISKPLTAVIAMQLWEEGKLDLDADVRLLVPEFPEPAEQRIVTTRQLLCHQGGIVHYTNGPVVKTPRPELEDRYIDIIDALDTFKASPLVGVPGEKYSYTTHGYILLGAVVQRAGGAMYPQQVQQRISSPLAMITLKPDFQWEEIPSRAVGYRRGRGENAGMVVSTDTDVSWKLAGGGWISSVDDLARLGVGLLGNQFVRPETRELMWTPQKTSDGEQTAYGLGFQIARHRGKLLVSHGGSQEKSRTLLAMLPDENVAVAIMCNTEGTNLVPLGRDLLTIVVGGQAEPAEDAPAPSPPAAPARPAAAQ